VQRRALPPRPQPRHHGRDEQAQRLVLIAGGGIVLLVAVLLAAGWYASYLQPYRQTVISVGSEHANMGYFISRMKELVPEFSDTGANVAVNALPEATLETIESELISLQRADRLGVTLTNDQAEAALMTALGVSSPAGSNYAAVRPAVESALTAKLVGSSLTPTQYRAQIRAEALANGVRTKLAADYPRTGPEAKYETISVSNQADAQKLVDRLNGGTDWETLVTEIHNNPSSGAVQQSDFQAKLQIDDKLVDPLFQLDPGGHTGVVATSDGKYTVARLIDKDDQHPITDDQVKAITPRLFANWLDEMKKTITVKDSLSDTQKLFAVERSGYKPPSQSQSPSQSAPQPQAPAPANPQQAPQFNPANLPQGISTPTGGFGSGAVPAPAGTQGP